MASKELQTIVAAWERACLRGQRSALVTVVETSGSTYRRPGARMLVIASKDGEAETVGADVLGSISGGCLEDDAREHAMEVIRTGQAALVRYDTTGESDLFFGTGAGCRGIVHVFIEPLPASDAVDSPLACVARSLRERRAGALAIVIGVEPADAAPLPGSFLWVDNPATGRDFTQGTIIDPDLANAIAKDARAAALRSRSERRIYPMPGGATTTVFIGVVQPARSLLICGAGQDAVPLARLANEMGWRVRITDGRRAYLTGERFPGADELIHCPAQDFGARITVEPSEAVMVMTHHYFHDRDILRAVLSSPAGYIGVLGPRERTERLLAEFAASDPPLNLDKHSLRRFHGPAGLDIGAEAPEQIALSIVAEIEAVTTGREGGMLRHRDSALHASGRSHGGGNTLSRDR